jgi:uncharacterized protein (TIGR00645 family)
MSSSPAAPDLRIGRAPVAATPLESDAHPEPTDCMPRHPALLPLPALIFSARWLQLPLYLGLIVAQGVYVILFVKELWHLLHDALLLSEQAIMLIVLGLIDVVMISNLLIMVIVGGYETFISRMGLENHPDQPEWLSSVNASVLKVKLATAIIGISSIHLLKTFINADNYSDRVLIAQTVIHITFLLSAMAIAASDRLMPQPKIHGKDHGQPPGLA